MPPALLCVLFGAVAIRASRPIGDPDDWWHLRLGNDLIDQHSLAAPHWSVFASVPWVPTEPLPEITAAYVNRWFGLPGLAVLFAAAALVVVLTVHAVCRLHAAALPAAVTTVVTVLAITGSLSPRPQLVSFVLLPVVVEAWLRSEHDHRVRWWLVPLSWAWSLCHGFWFIGVGYGFLFVAGFALSRKMPAAVLLRQFAVAVASLAVVALNPVGLGVLKAPLAVNSTSSYIQEWARTDLTSAAALASLAMVLVTAAVWATTRRGLTWPGVLVLVSALVWTWYAGRTVAVAGLVVAPLLAGALDQLVRAGSSIPDGSHERFWFRRSEALVLTVSAAVAATVVAIVAPVTAVRPGDVPTTLNGALDRLPPGTRVFNDYALGGWIAWRHPDLQQYIDGLITPYSERHAHDYVVGESASPGWSRIVNASGATAALLGEHSPLVDKLADRGWTMRGTDAGYVLLTAPAGRSPG